MSKFFTRTPPQSTNPPVSAILLTTIGAGLTLVGLSHFAVPRLWDKGTRLLFPHDTRAWVRRNGATETALGVGLTMPTTRPISAALTVLYAGHLGTRAIRAAIHWMRKAL